MPVRTHVNLTDLGKLKVALRPLVEGAGLALEDLDSHQAFMSKIHAQYGVTSDGVRLALREKWDGKKLLGRDIVIALRDPNPDNRGELITVETFNARGWEPMGSVRNEEPGVDSYLASGIKRSNNFQTTNAADVFGAPAFEAKKDGSGESLADVFSRE